MVLHYGSSPVMVGSASPPYRTAPENTFTDPGMANGSFISMTGRLPSCLGERPHAADGLAERRMRFYV
jgi:hypothetical protein